MESAPNNIGLMEPVFIPPFFRPRQHFEGRHENIPVKKEKMDGPWESRTLAEVERDQTITEPPKTKLSRSPIKVKVPPAHVQITAATLLTVALVGVSMFAI